MKDLDFREALSDLRHLVFRDLNCGSFQRLRIPSDDSPRPPSLLRRIVDASRETLETVTVEQMVLHVSLQLAIEISPRRPNATETEEIVDPGLRAPSRT